MENNTETAAPMPDDELLNQLRMDTADLDKGNIVEATADGEPTATHEPPPAEPETPAEPPAAPIPKSAWRKSAGVFIEVFDKIQKGLFAGLYKKKFVKPSDMERMETLKQECVMKSPLAESEVLQEMAEKDKSILSAYSRVQKYESYLSTLELTSEEKAAIQEPLAECLEKWKMQPVTPEGHLALAVGMIMISRVSVFLPVIGHKPVSDDSTTTTTTATATTS